MADHPITISNGSPLVLEHDSWDWDPRHHRRLGTAVHHAVTHVNVESKGLDLGSIPFNTEQLSIHLTYAKASGGTLALDLVTLPNGTHPVLTVDDNTSLADHFGRNGHRFVSNEHVSITGLTIKKGAVDVTPAGPFPDAANVTISYE